VCAPGGVLAGTCLDYGDSSSDDSSKSGKTKPKDLVDSMMTE
jgi:hypothetical protein